MEKIEDVGCFGGRQQVWQHSSSSLNCDVRFAVYLPPQAKLKKCPVLYWLSGLTCNEQNFITKAGAQNYAAEHGVIIVAPDTSPRGDDVANDEAYDLGQGAGFYINASEQPWAPHFRMYDYIVDELPALIEANFPVTDARGIFGLHGWSWRIDDCTEESGSLPQRLCVFSHCCPQPSALGRESIQRLFG